MDGSCHLFDITAREIVVTKKDHIKYVVHAAWSIDGNLFATTSYDRSIKLYKFTHSRIETPEIVLLETITVATAPESLIFLPYGQHLVISLRDNNNLLQIKLPSGDDAGFHEELINLNQNGDGHVSYSV